MANLFSTDVRQPTDYDTGISNDLSLITKLLNKANLGLRTVINLDLRNSIEQQPPMKIEFSVSH